MDIVPTFTPNASTATDMELVEQEKKEYLLLGTFVRTRGLRLFQWNHNENKLIEVKLRDNLTAELKIEDSKLVAKDIEHEVADLDGRYEYFESLNHKTALKHIAKFKAGKIKSLNNLRRYDPANMNELKFW